MDKKVYTALESVLHYLEQEQVELRGKMVGLCLPILRDYLARQRGSALIKTYWLFDEGLQLNFKFPLGQILATEGALSLAQATRYSLVALISRHASGDSGECTAWEQESHGKVSFPIFSSFYLNHTEKLWIITDSKREYTTLLIPDEFDVLYSCREIDLSPTSHPVNGAY